MHIFAKAIPCKLLLWRNGRIKRHPNGRTYAERQLYAFTKVRKHEKHLRDLYNSKKDRQISVYSVEQNVQHKKILAKLGQSKTV